VGPEAAFGDARCEKCAIESPSFERAVNYGAYTGTLRELIHLLKYERVRAVASLLGRLTSAACLQLEGDIDIEELLLVPVPTHKARMRSRGFNQAELIARAAQRGIAESIGRRVTLDVTTLLRVRFAESQVALSSEERRKQIRGSFKVTSKDRVKDREILLVDDVLTTGATASECAHELRQAGARRVWVVTPARALGRDAKNSLQESIGHVFESNGLSDQSAYGTSSSVPFTSDATRGTLLQRRGITPNSGRQ